VALDRALPSSSRLFDNHFVICNDLATNFKKSYFNCIDLKNTNIYFFGWNIRVPCLYSVA